MISSVFPGEIPGRSRLALLGRRGFPLSGSVTGKADRGLVTKVNLFYNGMTKKRLTFQGKYFNFQDVPMELEPLQQPYPPLWYPTRALDSVRQAAGQGYNCVTIGPADQVCQNVKIYWETWTAHQQETERLNAHVSEPKVGVMRQVVVADTDERLRLVSLHHQALARPTARPRRPRSGWTLRLGTLHSGREHHLRLTG